ncbi:MAG: L-arabinose isomerase [Firmicutes bacterium]|jgi:L-arabinose isomerase|nr:L-arabinose isomerase [Bacillota bacterium]NLL88426.1 L-arabinose isomerase [Bacillota bacterium]
MVDLRQYEVWFVTGSQHLYGDETLKQVASHSRTMVDQLNDSQGIPCRVVFKPVLTTAEAITKLCLEANSADNCIGLIAWMHTFSPAKMWINGLKRLQKPFVHLHTQFNRDIPWQEIDMDFMNLNQSAHGDREFGFIVTRLGIDRKVIVGYWQDPDIQLQLAGWMRAAVGWHEWQHTKVARFGDNMREVAVTEGNKVSSQVQFGFAVDGYGLGDLVTLYNEVGDDEVQALLGEYDRVYPMMDCLKPGGDQRDALVVQAKIELAMERFLRQGGYTAFTTTFEDLHGLPQLPGLAVQRLMKKGFGFGAEGDWKTAALLRAMKVMAAGLDGGTSFMEDYTYHLESGNMKILGAHMLEICESLAAEQPVLEVHQLSIGGKADPVRSLFAAPPGPAIAVTLVDLGHRFRMIVNDVEVVEAEALPKLPVARALWVPRPNLATAAAAWILAGGAHHTSFSQALTVQHMLDFAEIAGIECLVIDENTDLGQFKKELRWNQAYFG